MEVPRRTAAPRTPPSDGDCRPAAAVLARLCPVRQTVRQCRGGWAADRQPRAQRRLASAALSLLFWCPFRWRSQAPAGRASTASSGRASSERRQKRMEGTGSSLRLGGVWRLARHAWAGVRHSWPCRLGGRRHRGAARRAPVQIGRGRWPARALAISMQAAVVPHGIPCAAGPTPPRSAAGPAVRSGQRRAAGISAPGRGCRGRSPRRAGIAAGSGRLPAPPRCGDHDCQRVG